VKSIQGPDHVTYARTVAICSGEAAEINSMANSVVETVPSRNVVVRLHHGADRLSDVSSFSAKEYG
jgi:hypothetical protein